MQATRSVDAVKPSDRFVLYTDWAELIAHYPDAEMRQLTHSLEATLRYIQDWQDCYATTPVWKIKPGWYVVFSSEKGERCGQRR
jgi:hypothetical protein